MRTRDINKQELVKTKAMELIATGGFDSFSINKLAKACNISVATLYIYYKDKEDLIINLAIETAQMMASSMLFNFDAESSLEVGLWQQWQNRYRYMTHNKVISKFYEQLRSSSYYKHFSDHLVDKIGPVFNRFTSLAKDNGELVDIPLDIFWSVAYGPLYALIKFNNDGHSLAGTDFKLTQSTLEKSFKLVIKALRK